MGFPTYVIKPQWVDYTDYYTTRNRGFSRCNPKQSIIGNNNNRRSKPQKSLNPWFKKKNLN